LYAAGLTIVCGATLAFASISLKDRQQANIIREEKINILSTVMTLERGADINTLYAQRVRAFVIDFNGNVKEGMTTQQVVVAAEYKKKPQDRLLPVYEILSETDSTSVEAVVLPVYGFGLWNNIFGFVALGEDFNTIRGVSFGHIGETPGLGARISSDEVENRFQNKSIFDNGQLVSVMMQKGEGFDYSADPHKVDGISGSTLTAKGVNNMLKEYFACYQKYLQNKKIALNQY
jgi:Na+-transporting NADH:ubiquinone oxidoreductase subunit C